MFNDKPFAEVNREERFYCFLIAHAMLSSQPTRQNLVELIRNRNGIVLAPEQLQVFVEAAALRDYWNDLGDPVIYDEQTHLQRLRTLQIILAEVGVSPEELDKHDVFWTSAARKKLWNPGRWDIEALKATGLIPTGQQSERKNSTLIDVKWAFNAKPDLMIVSPGTVLLIEAKVEAGEGREGSGYEQYRIQELITKLLKLLVPRFAVSNFRNLVLARRAGDLSWADVVATVTDDVDQFTRDCLLNAVGTNKVMPL